MTVAAILLAAGQSRRMGICKQLLPLGESTVIGRCLGLLLEGGVTDITVVVSPGGEAVAAEAKRLPVRVVINQEPGGDMASSIRTGRDVLTADASSVMIALCDCPLVLPATIRLLRDTAVNSPDRIIIPTCAGRRGHPLIFPRSILDELTHGQILRDVVRRDPSLVIDLPVDDPGVLMDMDTPDDYRRVQQLTSHTM